MQAKRPAASSHARDCIQMRSGICYRPTKTSNGNVVQIFKACSSCRPPRYFPRGGGKMRKPLMELTAGIVAGLFLSLFAAPQSQPPKRPTPPGGPESLYDKLGDTGSGGPAPRRDLTGFWAGRVAAKINPVPAMTPWGLGQFDSHKNQGEYPVAESNDPSKSCDPLGFPRNVVFMVRGIAFAT